MGPADQQLGGGDGADPGLGEQGRRHDGDELAQFGLEPVGVLTGGQDPLGGQGQRLHGGPVLHRIGGGGDQPGAGINLLAPGAPPQGVPQRLGGGDDQGLELAAASEDWGHSPCGASLPAPSTKYRRQHHSEDYCEREVMDAG